MQKQISVKSRQISGGDSNFAHPYTKRQCVAHPKSSFSSRESYIRVDSSQDNGIQIIQLSLGLQTYRLSGDLWNRFVALKVIFEDALESGSNTEFELGSINRPYYETLERVLKTSIQGKPENHVIEAQEFEEALKGYVAEHVTSPELVINLYKAFHYLDYKTSFLFEELKIWPGIEMTISRKRVSFIISNDIDGEKLERFKLLLEGLKRRGNGISLTFKKYVC